MAGPSARTRNAPFSKGLRDGRIFAWPLAGPASKFTNPMTPEIQKAVEAGKLTKNQGAALEKLQPGSYGVHKSRGFGQIDAVDFLVNQMPIHFKSNRGHSMQLPYAPDSLQPIAPEHILAEKAADLDGV